MYFYYVDSLTFYCLLMSCFIFRHDSMTESLISTRSLCCYLKPVSCYDGEPVCDGRQLMMTEPVSADQLMMTEPVSADDCSGYRHVCCLA